MPNLFDLPDGSVWCMDDAFHFELNENNIYANLHRAEPLKDVVAVEDPRDEAWWASFRYDTEPQQFERMLQIAAEVGTLMMRNTPLEYVEELFNNRFQITEADFDELLGDEDER